MPRDSESFQEISGKMAAAFHKMPVHSRLFLAENDILAVQKNSVILCVRKPCNREKKQVTWRNDMPRERNLSIYPLNFHIYAGRS